MVDKLTQMLAMKQVSITGCTYSSSASTTKSGNNNTNSALQMIFQYIYISIVPVSNVSLLLVYCHTEIKFCVDFLSYITMHMLSFTTLHSFPGET